MDLIQLVYVSSLQGEDESHIGAILQSCAERNVKNGITGMLLYYRGGLMQVLEGEDLQVQETYGRICADTRHRDILTLSSSEIPGRHFENWSMGYKYVAPTAVAKFPKYAPFFNFRTDADKIKGDPGLALEMLTMFANGMKSAG